jgi:RND family efflux transporter MFP subunit
MPDQLSSDLASLHISRDEAPPRRGYGRLLLWLGLLGVAAVTGYQFGVPYLEAQVFKTEVEVTEVTKVSPAQAQIELTSTGYVVAERETNVAVKVPGKVSRVAVVQGDEVKAGDVLFELDTADQKASIAAAQSRVATARARAEQTRAQLSEIELRAKRELRLSQAGVAPAGAAEDLAAQVGSLKQAVKAAEAEVAAAQAEVHALRVNLGSYVVASPIDGTVLNKPPELGEYAGPQPAGIAVDMGGVQVADFSTLVVETDVPEARLHLVKLGGPTEIILDAFPERRYRGKAREITPQVNRAKATVTVKVEFVDDKQGVLPDMSARVSFLSEALDEKSMKQAPKVVVPSSAVADRNGGKIVFLVEDGIAHMKPVELGERFGSGFEVKAGVVPGNRVVNKPPGNLSDGQRIKEASGA